MGWILLEAFIALVIAVAIVAWTMAARRKSPVPPAQEVREDRDREGQ